MAFGDNVSVQIFPNSFLTEQGLATYNNPSSNLQKPLETGFDMAVGDDIVTCKNVQSSSTAWEMFYIEFNNSVSVYPGMLIEINDSTENVEYNGRWRVCRISPDRKTIYLQKKKSFNTNVGAISTFSLSSSTSIRIPSLGMERTQNGNDVWYGFKGCERISHTITGGQIEFPRIKLKTSIYNNIINLGGSTTSDFPNIYSSIWTKHFLFGNAYSINTQRIEPTYKRLDEVIIFPFSKTHAGFYSSYKDNENVSFRIINHKFTGSGLGFFKILDGRISMFELESNTNFSKIIPLSPIIQREVSLNDRTLATYPWMMWQEDRSFPIKIPGVASFLTMERKLFNTGYHVNWQNNQVNGFYTSFSAKETFTEMPVVIPLNDEYWVNHNINQEWD